MSYYPPYPSNSGTPYPPSSGQFPPMPGYPPSVSPGYPPPSSMPPVQMPTMPGGPVQRGTGIMPMPGIPQPPFHGTVPYPPPPVITGHTSGYPVPPAPMPMYGPTNYPPSGPPTYPNTYNNQSGPPTYPNNQPTYPSNIQAVPSYNVPLSKPVPTHTTREEALVTQAQQKMAAMSVSSSVPVTHGTVQPNTNFDAEADAVKLYNAMKGFGTDEKAIILVLTRCSNVQRQEIRQKFKAKYGKDLIAELKSELSGNFEKVILALMMTPTEYDAFCLFKAMEGAGTDESTLIEILCSRDSKQITEIKSFYKKEYKHELEKDVYSETSGHFRKMLISLLTADRDPDGTIDMQKARQDAQALYQAGEAKFGTDESVFNTILCARSNSHLKIVFKEYAKISKYDIEQSISREMSGDLKEGMTTIVKCIKDIQGYFAERLYKSMKGLGTDDRTLIRVMVTRCEVDMLEIKSIFERTYRKSLESFVSGDTSGDYKRVLLALIGEF